MMQKFESILTRVIEWLLACCLLAMATIVISLVVLRYALNSSITGANEAITILFVYTTALGAAVAIGKREHIAITVATDALGPRGQRIADMLGFALIAVFCGVTFWYSIAWIRVTGGYLMPATQLPRFVAQLSIPLGCSLAILYCLLRLTRPHPEQNGRPASAPPARLPAE